VLGSPVAHSLSPVMHRAAYAVLGLDWRYDAYDVDEAGLPGFLDALDASWRGLSLTMPLKRAVLPLLDDVSPVAREVAAVNTVVLDEGRRSGDNTDVPGLAAALAERGVAAVTSAAVLGTGATAASAVAALHDVGLARLSVHGRNREHAAALADWAQRRGIHSDVGPLTAPPQGGLDAVVSTVPAGLGSELAQLWASQAAVVVDVAYDPLPSPLLARAAAAGRTTVTGLDLLAHQGVLQVQAMTGRQVAVDVLRRAAVATLGCPP